MRIDVQLPKLYEKQHNAIFCKTRFAAIEASTKCGKTHGCIVWLFYQAINMPDYGNAWWVAPSYRQAIIAYRRMKRALKGFKDIVSFNETDLKIFIKDAGTISFISGEKPDNLYGDDVMAVVIDEASRCREEVWFVIRSTLTATKGLARLIGNVKGKDNFFYRLSRAAESGAKDWTYSSLTAYDAVEAGIIDLDEIESAKADLPESIFNELYLNIPSGENSSPFGYDAIQSCIISSLSKEPPVAFGVDLGRKVDYTVIIGLDINGRMCHYSRFKTDWQTTTDRILKETRGIPTLMDSTGLGDVIFNSLQPYGNFSPFIFSQPSKQQLIEGLSYAINIGAVGFLDNEIVKELISLEYEHTRTGIKYYVPKGCHDDCIMSLVLAYRRSGRGIFSGALPDSCQTEVEFIDAEFEIYF